MDTDSSLPPLLLLAASLLIFAWTSIAAASRRQPPAFAVLWAQPRSPAIVVLRVTAAATAGVSALGVTSALASDWPTPVLLPAATLAAAAALIILHLLVEWWATLFPDAARRFAYPGRWWSDPVTSSGNGDWSPPNGTNGQTVSADARLPDPNRANWEPPPLTPAEIMRLDSHDIHMVRSISRMDDLDVREIMVPSLDVAAVAVSSSMQELVDVLISTKHSRLPVYRGTMDDVVGVIHISDVLLTLASGPSEVSTESIMREPEFVAENMAVDDLLQLMREKNLQMAIVVDEYGGVEGIVTLEDVLEEIVGDIDDEFAEDTDELTTVGDGSWLVNATMPAVELAEAMGIELDHGEVNTIGGFVYAQLGRMATVGDVVTAAGLTIEVTQVRGRRIHQLRLSPDGGEGGEARVKNRKGAESVQPGN